MYVNDLPVSKEIVVPDRLSTAGITRHSAAAMRISTPISGQQKMTFYTETLAGSARTARIRISNDIVSIAGDLLPFFDFVSVIVAGYLSTYIYAHLLPNGYGPGFWDEYRKEVLIVAVLAAPALRDGRFGSSIGNGVTFGMMRRFARRFIIFTGIVLAIGFASRSLDTLPRLVVVLGVGATIALTATFRCCFASYVHLLQRRGVLSSAIAIVGAGPVADRLIRHLQQTKAGNMEVLGVFDDAAGHIEGVHVRSSGTVSDLIELGKTRKIDWVLITLPSTAEHRLLPLVHSLKSLAVSVGLCPQNIGLSIPCQTIDYVCDGLPVTLLADRPLKRWNAVIKATEDFLVGGIITVLALPVLAIIALAIRLDSPGPIIFKQRRHTFNNIEFDVYKFRTMRWQGDIGGEVLKQTGHNDGRITRVGRFLRKSSLDELPQLFNVMKGEMSLVGPRPHAVDMRTEQRLCHEIIDTYPHRHRVKPGMTGWSQVNGSRGATETAEQLRRRIELDLYYVENWSLTLDLWILAMTHWVVLRGTNAR